MTLQELYVQIDGSYQHAAQIMKMDKLISRYVLKFPKSSVGEDLAAAGESMDPTRLFEAAHAMKGVCANMGFDKLSDAAREITEEFRPGNPRQRSDAEIKALLSEIDAMYKKTVAGIKEYEQSL
jgi:HPt (histidine-containing phosphotransfer) domain-containing protein